MTSTGKGGSRAVLWQGFHHAWEYNHRLNRFGSYVRSRHGQNGHSQVAIGHTAASGTGDDMAHFAEYATDLRSTDCGIAFQAGVVEATAECQRGDLTPFIARISDLGLDPELQNRDVYTVVLNGFDLYADQFSEKIMTFDLEVTDATVSPDRTKMRFSIIGNLQFDCRSPECQLLPLRIESERRRRHEHRRQHESADAMSLPAQDSDLAAEMPEPRRKRGIDRRKVDRVAHWLKQKLQRLTGVEEVKRSIIGEGGDTLRRRLFSLFGRDVYLRFLKWRFSAPYILRVYYLIIAGNHEALAVSESPYLEHTYSWDLEHEIHHEECGTLAVKIPCIAGADHSINTLAFRHIYLDVVFDEELGSEDPIQWGKGMHLLEWHTAIRDIESRGGSVTANLDLFYKNWSEAMNEVITLTTWGAVRAAGQANLGVRLALLQMRGAVSSGQLRVPGRIYWPGRGLSARTDPRARCEQALPELDPNEVQGDAPSA